MASLVDAVVARKRTLRATQTLVTHADGTQCVESVRECASTMLASRVSGYVVDMQPDATPALICDHLYLGSQDCVDIAVLRQFHIRYVLSVGIQVQAAVLESCIIVKFVECLDLPETNIWEVLDQCYGFIRDAIETKSNILVHCNAGVSRSPAIVVGFLMRTRNIDFPQAFDLVKSRRSAVKLNEGFVRQLATEK